jgi:uncharacterized protein (DUF169 family)
MRKHREYAKRLREIEGLKRRIIAFKNYEEVPRNVEHYGDDVSFHCAIVAEALEDGGKPFYITRENIMCGGALYSGIGTRKTNKEEFDGGMSLTLGVHRGYADRQVFRRVNQQVPHHFIHQKYQVIGGLEDVVDPDIVLIVDDAYKIMRLCKAYTWKTGELVQGISGTAWCTNSFPHVFKTKALTFNMGDEQSRCLMNLDPGDMYCMIHYKALPIIVENIENIQTGLAT